MAYDKPKVTIDLEEYNELLKQHDKPVVINETMYKIVIAELINSRGDISRAMHSIKSQGVYFIINNADALQIGLKLIGEDIEVKRL